MKLKNKKWFINKNLTLWTTILLASFLLTSFMITGGFGYSLSLKTIVGEVSFQPAEQIKP